MTAGGVIAGLAKEQDVLGPVGSDGGGKGKEEEQGEGSGVHFGFWILDFGFWILDFGFWIWRAFLG